MVIGKDNVKFGETGIDFANRVGWRLKDNWLDYDYLNFSLDAAFGHLPFFNFILLRRHFPAEKPLENKAFRNMENE